MRTKILSVLLILLCTVLLWSVAVAVRLCVAEVVESSVAHENDHFPNRRIVDALSGASQPLARLNDEGGGSSLIHGVLNRVSSPLQSTSEHEYTACKRLAQAYVFRSRGEVFNLLLYFCRLVI